MAAESRRGATFEGTWAIAVLAVIVVAGAALRVHGFNWDDNHLFHPDERWIVIVAGGMERPASLAEFVSPASPINPFWDPEAGESRRFAYGHLPVYLLRAAGSAALRLGIEGPEGELQYLGLVGRALSVATELLTIVLTYALGRRLFGVTAGLLAAAGVALATLHVQQAHFYTVDPPLVTLVMLALLAMTIVAETGSHRASIVAGVASGLAIGTKSSALIILFPLILAHAIYQFDAAQQQRVRTLVFGPRRLRSALDLWDGLDKQRGWQALLPALIVGALAFVVTNPYAVLDAYHFADSIKAQSRLVQGQRILPYTEQFRGTWPYLYFIGQQLRWFLGPALGLLAWAGFGWMLVRLLRRRVAAHELPAVAWGILYFAVTGAVFMKFPRYFLPLTPLLFIWGAALILKLTERRGALRVALVALVFVPSALYALAFTAIYDQQHPWVQASNWVYKQAPRGSAILIEQWDHPLPSSMEVDRVWRTRGEYEILRNDPYDPETPEKAVLLAERLSETQWIILASPRGWGVLGRLGDQYPLMPPYYEALLDGRAGFEVAGLWRVEPQLGPVSLRHNPFVSAFLPTPQAWETAAPARWTLDLGFADESFSVYDHPLTIVLRKTRSLDAETLQATLWPDRATREAQSATRE
ncbi:MAG TPA: glycosyltransferase family 39 protein [Ardenticatenaceae bacterium]|nr:glycosyltransferase family 39 protein [Ardenticatenaceae bacterium]